MLQKAVRLGKPSISKVAPKPAVGALLVKNGRIIASAAYTDPRGTHAEVQALKIAGPRAAGATLYVSLEPCTWWKGKLTKSCSQLVVHSGVRKVVVAMRDPRPEVNGKGIQIIRRAGIKVEIRQIGEAKKIFAPYLLWLKRRKEPYHKPYVLMKTAMSLDGKIAGADGKAVAFSNAVDAKEVQKLRASVDAILIGGRTLIKDDPRLTVRDPHLISKRIQRGIPAQPIKVAVIRDARNVNVRGRFFAHGGWRKVIFTTNATPSKKIEELRGVADVFVDRGKHVDLKKTIRKLWHYGVRRVLLEGGGRLNHEMLRHGLVDEMRVAIAPVLVGKVQTPSLIDGKGRLPEFRLKRVERLQEMLILWYRVQKGS